jgi:hypothetical protein
LSEGIGSDDEIRAACYFSGMSIFAIARLAGSSIAAASLVSSMVFVVRRFALHARGAGERPSGELLSSAEVDSLSDKRMGQDRLSMVCHRLSVMGFLAGALGHLFSALENAPFMAAASPIISLLTFAGFVMGGAALMAGSILPEPSCST